MADSKNSKNCINLQIKVYPEEKDRFLKLKDEMDEVSTILDERIRIEKDTLTIKAKE